MFKISKLCVSLQETQAEILKDIDLVVKPGEVRAITGPNGSGKSTLAGVIAGDPRFEITSGRLELNGEDLTNSDPTERSLAGIFLAHQHPLEIPGLSLSNYLRMVYNARQENPMPIFKFRKLLKQKAELIDYPQTLLDRNLNEGFSGGEKKKTEILQLAIIEPKLAILDETDSGLDKDAILSVFDGINMLRENTPQMSIIVISHYDRVFEIVTPKFTHKMKKGKLIYDHS